MNNDIVDKFSTHLKNVLTRALCFVVETNRQSIEPVHLLWALGTQRGCIGAEILNKAHVKAASLRELIGAASSVSLPDVGQMEGLTLQLSPDAKRVLEKAVLTAHVYGHRYIGTEHLLSGLMQVGGPTITRFFEQENIHLATIKEQLALVLKSTSKLPDLTQPLSDPEEAVPSAQNESAATVNLEEDEQKKTPALDYFGIDLTTEAAQESIDPVIGREEEIMRVMEILSRRTKNNPLLVGEPGVGKTAIVEGFAKKVFTGDVPDILQGKRVVALDLALVIAGTMYRGEFEARLRQIIDEAKADPNLILFIDEVHTIVGAGAASGSMDAANILKPALARGDIHCIGATTPEEFKKSIENDRALERRFQTIRISEPSEEKSVSILEGVLPYYERFHRVKFAPGISEASVRLASRYIPDKQLPDKALDLLDEAAASMRVHSQQPDQTDLRKKLRHQLEALRSQKRQAVIEERFLDAVALKEQESLLQRDMLQQTKDATPAPTVMVTERHIAQVVSRMTRIPLADILLEDQARLKDIDAQLSERVLGQEAAVLAVADALRRAKTGMAPANRPLASFLFLGPSGVGKTELAKSVADIVFHDPKSLIRLDMSEFAEGFTISKLIGAPAGYVGYREKARLTDAIKARPHAVVLFDELEKAHADVQNLLLQLLEEGEVTDSTGRNVSFRHTIVVLTSNVGLEKFERGNMGFHSTEEDRRMILSQDLKTELEERFRPELLNRIDHTLVFRPLSKEALAAIARKQLAEFSSRVKERGIALEIMDGIAEYLAEQVNQTYGARDIRRHIQTHIEAPIAKKLTQTRPAKHLRVDMKRGKLSIVRPAS